jgi:hypothetical protein
MRRSLLVALVALAACGPASPHGGPNNGPDANPSSSTCTGSETRCVDNNLYQECVDGTFQTSQTCAKSCSPTLGCVDCDPTSGNTCNGNDVVSCTSDGHYGGVVKTCSDGSSCSGGSCSNVCSADGVQLIYVVDEQNELLSFDPTKIAGGATQAFHKIGTLNCPAKASWLDWQLGQPGPATPFSMSVDRNAIAWVLYSSGEIFKVKTSDASCIGNSGYQQGTDFNAQNGMEVFGMGFVTDTANGNTEKLYLGGGNISATPGGKLAVLDPASPAKATLIPTGLPSIGEHSPELTGTGAAEMFGFFPGSATAFVQQIPKTGGSTGQKWSIPGGLGGGASKQIRGWAFAQWGGTFYIFVSTDDDGMGKNLNSTVQAIDRATGAHKVVFQNLPYMIVGAGVSTCAPVVVN